LHRTVTNAQTIAIREVGRRAVTPDP
jgi:hypothetical protein